MQLLLWIEPIYIRDSRVTYAWVAARFAAALIELQREAPETARHVRMFCNRATAEQIRSEAGAALPDFILPTAEEEAQLEGAFRPWQAEGQARWIRHMEGEEAYSNGYRAMLERVYREFRFDAILHWGTNRILRSFAEAHGIVPLFAELGPVRAPFVQTGVIDTFGVNGDSCIATGDQRVMDALGHDRWARPRPATERRAVHHAPFRTVSGPRHSNGQRYILVPLQTADDANVLVHHAGKDYAHEIATAVTQITARGWRCLVKTHPASQASEYTRLAEADLLNALAPRAGVELLTEQLDPAGYVDLLAQASGVVTFNSSVGCEASMLGTPVHVIAKACYAPPGRFAGMNELLDGITPGESWLARMVDVHELVLNRYLMPLDDVFDPRRVLAAAQFWRDLRLQVQACGPAAWYRRWTAAWSNLAGSGPDGPLGLDLSRVLPEHSAEASLGDRP